MWHHLSYKLSYKIITLKNDIKMTCSEQNFGKIGKIEVFDLANISTKFNSYTSKRFVSSGDVTATNGFVLPLYPGSAKVSEGDIRGRGGYGYEVSLSWQVSRPSESDFNALDNMRKNVKCLKITAFGGSSAYIIADEDHYQFDYHRDGEFLNCSLKVYNINGIQQVI